MHYLDKGLQYHMLAAIVNKLEQTGKELNYKIRDILPQSVERHTDPHISA